MVQIIRNARRLRSSKIGFEPHIPLEYFATSPTQQMETTKGTLFGTYNSVAGYFQNVSYYKNDEAKFNSIMSGNALGKAQATFDLCNDFARVVSRPKKTLQF